MPHGRLANHVMSWTPRGSGRRQGCPTKIWRSTFKEDLVDRGVDLDQGFVWTIREVALLNTPSRLYLSDSTVRIE